MWAFHTEELRWEAVDAGAGPSPRGGCQCVVVENIMLLHGGPHCVAVDANGEETETVCAHVCTHTLGRDGIFRTQLLHVTRARPLLQLMQLFCRRPAI